LVNKLRDRIEIQELIKEPDGAGGFLAEWRTIEETWASVTPMKGIRALEFSQTAGFYPYQVKMRQAIEPDLTRQRRLIFKGKSMVMHSVLNHDERNFVSDVVAYYKDSVTQNPTIPGS
jgi:head-tail adaptor